MSLIEKNERFIPESFAELLADDTDNIIGDVAKPQKKPGAQDLLESKSKEVLDFISEHHRLPDLESHDWKEKTLARRCKALCRDDPAFKEQCERLAGVTATDAVVISRSAGPDKVREEVIEEPAKPPKGYKSMNDIFNDDDGLLDNLGSALPKEDWRRNDPKPQPRSKDNQTAMTGECQDFFHYQRYFDEIKDLLAKGKLGIRPIKGSNGSIGFGDVFVHKGVMSIIASIDERNVFHDEHFGDQFRMRQIFENGKESNVFNLTLRADFYKKSAAGSVRVIAVSAEGASYLEKMKAELRQLGKGTQTKAPIGYIYILKSLSKNPAIREFAGNSELVKIGFSTTDVRTRVRNAENEPTYLCAPVFIAETVSCLTCDPSTLEHLVHGILRGQRLNIELKDRTGKTYRPREWFAVSVETASEIVRHIINNDLQNYYVDPLQGKLRPRQNDSGHQAK
ncbi:MAG: GIY-YIG nuclease family protein [Succinivibrio sp.]